MKRLIIIYLTVTIVLILGCSKNPIDDLYTNPDAIVDILNATASAVEANNPRFIHTDEYYDLSSPLNGAFGTTSFMLEMDSSKQSFDIDIGDTVFINNLWAKEAIAQVQYENYYTLTLQNDIQQTVSKSLVTNPVRAYKRAYLLQLGSFSSPGRGWVYWGTSTIFNMAFPQPNISWRSEAVGTLNNTSNIIYRSDFTALQPGDKIVVRYVGQSDDIAFLNINEDGHPHRLAFSFVEGTAQEVSWTISNNPTGKDYYYYAGVEIYRQETLASTDLADTDFFYTGLMYSIESE